LAFLFYFYFFAEQVFSRGVFFGKHGVYQVSGKGNGDNFLYDTVFWMRNPTASIQLAST
jgi:hypothetical protein